MYMSMPMAAQALPILGSCSVNDKKISLKFPLSSVSFEMPDAPYEGGKDMDFKMAGPRGEMSLKIAYNTDLKAFMGKGTQEGQNVLTFVFSRSSNPIQALKAL